MDTRYSSFLIRCWSCQDGSVRLVIEHVQSGERAAMPSMAAALERLVVWCNRSCGEPDEVQIATSATVPGVTGDRRCG